MGQDPDFKVGSVVLEGRTPPPGGSGVTIGQQPAPTHAHTFVFLRQEQRLEQGYKPDRFTYDVFHCSECLAYREVLVAKESESRERFGYDVYWRKSTG